MYSEKFLSFLVLFNFFICALSADVQTIDTFRTPRKDSIQNFTTKENVNLQIRLHGMQPSLTQDCNGTCEVNNHTKVKLSCIAVEDPEKQESYLNVSVKDELKTDLSGEWACTYFVRQFHVNDTDGKEIKNSFNLEIKSEKTTLQKFCATWPCLHVGVGALVGFVLLVIAVQTYCIIHFRKKAKAVRRNAEWSIGNKDNTEDISKTVRYSKMPGLKKKEVLIPESRESGIYEVLDNIRVAPDPPPVETLPRNKAAQKSSPVPIDPPASTPAGTSLFNSLLRRKMKKVEDSGSDSKTSTLDKRTTLDRIKERLPLALPTEEDFYEAMDTPQPVRKEVKKKVPLEKAAPKEEIRIFTPPKPNPAVQLPANVGNAALPLNLQLKKAVEKKNRLIPPPPKPLPIRQNATVQPPIPKQKTWQKESPLPKEKVTTPREKVWPKETTIPKEKVWPNESALPKAKVWPNETTIPKEKVWPNESSSPKAKVWPKKTTIPKEKVWPNESSSPKAKVWPKETTIPKQMVWPNESSLPKAKVWPREATVPKQAEWQRETPSQPQEQEIQRPMGPQRPKVTLYNPGLPPPDAPPAKVRTPWVLPTKPRPPPPAKPKQLHPLPHPPCEPEPIHAVTEHDRDSDDSEEWVYEPLPQYNIYSN